jgi:hypothetical protein
MLSKTEFSPVLIHKFFFFHSVMFSSKEWRKNLSLYVNLHDELWMGLVRGECFFGWNFDSLFMGGSLKYE